MAYERLGRVKRVFIRKAHKATAQGQPGYQKPSKVRGASPDLRV